MKSLERMIQSSRQVVHNNNNNNLYIDDISNDLVSLIYINLYFYIYI